MERDPKWQPAVGDLFKADTPAGDTIYRVVVEVVVGASGNPYFVNFIRGKKPGQGPLKKVVFSAWRAYARRANYICNINEEEVPPMGKKLHPRLIRLQKADTGPGEGSNIIWINPDDVTCVSEIQNPHASGFYTDRCHVDTKQPFGNGFIRHEVVGHIDAVAMLINRGEDDPASPLIDLTPEEESDGVTTWGERGNRTTWSERGNRTPKG